ncbi:hypothetical protein [Zoogloea sp.]|uniref:hypothetical protein n=1 Tax=Zoogloea sp. TaxID=49181 RepID=UPI0035B08515
MGKRVKMIFPVPMSEATRPMVESQLPPEFRRPDIDVSFVGAGNTITLADSYYDMAIMELAVIQAGIQAEEESAKFSSNHIQQSPSNTFKYMFFCYFL